ncbi:MAG: ABC transporter permease [Coriobacteriia bacterium]|nr:ABC transporter permease [Coriobacteriia bacterium]
MRLVDVVEETPFSVSSNKVRSALTILGIVVGIASVIVMVAIGQGAQASITNSINQAGSNLVMVMPGFGGGGGAVRGARGAALTLTEGDAQAIATQVTGVSGVSQERSSRQQVIAGANNTNTSIMGATPVYQAVHSIQIAEGQFVSANDVASVARVAVLGPTTRDDLFGVGATNVVGKRVRINGIDFRIIGITVAKGGSGFNNQDDVVYAPLTTVQQLLVGDPHLSQISVQAANANDVAAVEAQITTLLLSRHKISNAASADFTVLSQSDIAATASTVTGTFTIVLASIAGISLLVGGIGIMNMMLTAVTERTREIGLRKAVGARRNDISMQFLAESVALTFLGGLIGVLLGIGISAAITAFAGVTTQVSIPSVLLAAGVSIGIGVVFGYYPALRASGMNPVEALRYQ